MRNPALTCGCADQIDAAAALLPTHSGAVESYEPHGLLGGAPLAPTALEELAPAPQQLLGSSQLPSRLAVN